MADNFGPPKKRLTSLTEYAAAFNTNPIERQFVNSTWYKNKPIYQEEQLTVVATMMDTAGNLHNPLNTSGEFVEASAVDILGHLENLDDYAKYSRTTMGAAGPPSQADENQVRLGAANITLVGGVVTNVELVPSKVGFTGYVMPYALWASDDDEYILVFQDEDDAPLNPTNCDAINVEIKHDNELSPIVQTHGAAGDNSGSSATDIFFYGIADAKALEIDVSGGAGGETLVLYYKYWYET